MSQPSSLMRWLVALVVLAVAAAGALPAWGQAPTPPKPGPWSFEATPYLWAAGLHGDLSARGRSATVDPSFSDLLKDLDFGAMLLAELRYDRWGLLLDGFYMKLSKDADTPGPLFSEVDVTSRMGMLGPSLGYRAVLTDRFTLDVLGGARIWFVDTELEFKPGLLPGVTVDQSKSWVDPIVGLRLGAQLTDKIFLWALGDVGGFGAGSDLTWQAIAGIGYRFNPRWSVTAGYRALGLDFQRDGFELDVIMHGPVVGVGFRF
jgi:opacity protein-like surface antigen